MSALCLVEIPPRGPVRVYHLDDPVSCAQRLLLEPIYPSHRSLTYALRHPILSQRKGPTVEVFVERAVELP